MPIVATRYGDQVFALTDIGEDNFTAVSKRRRPDPQRGQVLQTNNFATERSCVGGRPTTRRTFTRFKGREGHRRAARVRPWRLTRPPRGQGPLARDNYFDPSTTVAYCCRGKMWRQSEVFNREALALAAGQPARKAPRGGGRAAPPISW